jgi:hypothetical protein
MAREALIDGFAAVFEDFADPRTDNAARHSLLEILLIALCRRTRGYRHRRQDITPLG